MCNDYIFPSSFQPPGHVPPPGQPGPMAPPQQQGGPAPPPPGPGGPPHEGAPPPGHGGAPPPGGPDFNRPPGPPQPMNQQSKFFHPLIFFLCLLNVSIISFTLHNRLNSFYFV